MQPNPITRSAPRPTGSLINASVHGRQINHKACERYDADHAIEKNRISRGAPVGMLADEPDAHRVAAHAGGQRLVEERRDHAVAERSCQRQRGAAADHDQFPAHGQRDGLDHQDQEAKNEPGRIDLAEAVAHRFDVDQIEGEIEQQPRNRRLGNESKRLAHDVAFILPRRGSPKAHPVAVSSPRSQESPPPSA